MKQHARGPRVALAVLASLSFSGCSRRHEAPPSPAPEVSVVTMEPQQVRLTSELPGRTAAYLVAEIRPQVNGLLQKRLFTEGATVEAGQELYQIDPAPYQAALDNAEANLLAARKGADRARSAVLANTAALERHESIRKLAQTNLQRYESLVKTHAVSAMQLDQAASDVEVAEASLRTAEAQLETDREAVGVAEATIKQAEAALETARINLGYTKITAPISGRIGRSQVTEGAIVTAYQSVPLATIQQLDPIFVDVPQSTAEVNRLRRGLASGNLKDGTDTVRILLEDGTQYPLEGSLKFRDVTVDPTTGSIILRIVVPNPEGVLLPGMFVRAIIDEGCQEQAILLPQQAMSRSPKGDPVALIVDADEKVQQREFVTSRAIGDRWLVASGLAAGDRVIVEGSQKVRPGMAVKAVPFEPKGVRPVESTAQSTNDPPTAKTN